MIRMCGGERIRLQNSRIRSMSSGSALLADLAAYWRLDNTGTVADRVGTNDMATAGTVVVCGGYGAYGIDPNGTNQFLSIASNSNLQAGDVALWIACWVDHASAVGEFALVSKWETTGNVREYALVIGDGSFV